MKLYEVPKQSKIKLIDSDDIFYFDHIFVHIDGMYSFCLDKNKQIVHLAAWSEVEIVK